MGRDLGYIATNRSIFEHWIARNPKRFKAWQWLIADAVHAPQGRRGPWGVIHLERGQLATSVRILARKWRWPKTNVSRFLRRLRRDGMIESKTGTLNGTPSGPRLDHMITVITICNYEQYNRRRLTAKQKAGQQAGQQAGHPAVQAQLFAQESTPLTIEPLNHIKKEKGYQQGGPRHGLQSLKHKTIYVHKATAEWRVFAEDYRAVIGAEPLPDRYGGFWFYNLGEAARPAHQRHWNRSREWLKRA